jgi:hypothetical protein
MGGGNPILMLTSTLAIAGMGMILTNAKSAVPIIIFFTTVPPLLTPALTFFKDELPVLHGLFGSVPPVAMSMPYSFTTNVTDIPG